MSSILSIIKKNSETFYDFRTKERISIRFRVGLTLVLSVISSFMFRYSSAEFLNGVITVQSILIGFSFSVMFFLASMPDLIVEKGASLEKKLKADRISLISTEIFYNISYYNFISIICLVLSLAFLLPRGGVVNLLDFINILHLNPVRIIVVGVVEKFMEIPFYFCLIESIYTFIRTIFRLIFLFDQKLSLKK